MNLKILGFYKFFLVFLISTSFVLANEKLKFAESYEKSGDFKSSARIYAELFESNPKISEYFDGLVRSYKALNQYTELLPYIEKRLSISKIPENYGIYGEILWRLGKTNEANQAWKDGLNSAAKIQQTYETIAKYQIAVKQFEKAIATYKIAREINNSEYLFNDELSQLFIAVGNAEEGLREILTFFEITQNTPTTEGRLSALKLIPGAETLIDKELNKRYSNSDKPEAFRLLIWHLRSNNMHEKALDLCIKLDKLMKSNGFEVHNFARTSQSDGHYDIALKAYEILLDLGDKNPYFQNGLYGLARTLEQKMELSNSFNDNVFIDLINKYKNIIKKYPNTSAAFDCQFRIALINFNNLKNINSAKLEFEALYKLSSFAPSIAESGIYLSKISIIENDFEKALNYLNNTINKFGKSYPNIKEKAMLDIADLYFYMGEIDTAQKLYDAASLLSSSDISNNALEMSMIIENNKTQNLAIRQFAKAKLLERQNLKDSAIITYKMIYKSGAGSELDEIARLAVGNLLMEKKDFNNSITELKELITKFPESIFNDQAEYLICKAYFSSGNKVESEKSLKEFLAKYPKSLLLSDARALIKKIRAAN